MSPIEFCRWLQGFFELSGDQPRLALTVAQTQMIREHLTLVFTRVTGKEKRDLPVVLQTDPELVKLTEEQIEELIESMRQYRCDNVKIC